MLACWHVVRVLGSIIQGEKRGNLEKYMQEEYEGLNAMNPTYLTNPYDNRFNHS